MRDFDEILKEIEDENDASKAFGILILVVIVFIASYVIGYWLWDGIAVEKFNLPELTFWQYIGLQILIQQLFGTRLTTSKKGGK